MMRGLGVGVLACVLGSVAPRARAQAFNMDMGSSVHPVPSPAFGGAANQPGFWNSVDESSVPPYTRVLADLNGQPTSVTVAVTTLFSAPGVYVFADPPGFTADESALFSDSLMWAGSPAQSTITVTITGLAPGAYDFYGYPGNVNSEGSFYVSECGFSPACTFFSGTFTLGSVWNLRCCQTSTGTFHIIAGTCGSPLSDPAINALQIVPRAFSCADVSEAYCSGVASSGACPCPCGNCTSAGHGCENSFATGGGRLRTSGTASVGADTLVLNADLLPPTSSALFYQGTLTTGGGFGTVYGDGLRCVAGSAIRLGTRFATGGVVAFGAGQGSDPLVSVAGAIPPGGGTRYYQVWYRNAPVYCTAASVNLTNGFKVRWTP